MPAAILLNVFADVFVWINHALGLNRTANVARINTKLSTATYVLRLGGTTQGQRPPATPTCVLISRNQARVNIIINIQNHIFNFIFIIHRWYL